MLKKYAEERLRDQVDRVEHRGRRIVGETVTVQTDRLLEAIGRSEAWQRQGVERGDLARAEFRVFSQWNEDGIIQHLISHTPLAERSFIEFGVEDYRESNTRFLLVNDNWRGLILDLSADFEDFIADSGLAWRHPIESVVTSVSRNNVNRLFADAGFTGDVGLMSIDIDGNDYWVWETCDIVRPRIVVCEYNATWGLDHKVCVPYDPEFVPAKAHPSRLCYGASLPALAHLARAKGYDFVGCESHGVNAFFVRSDVNQLPIVSVEDGYRYSTFRTHHTGPGKLGYVSDRTERLRIIRDCVIEDVVTHERRTVADLYGV